MIHPIQRRRFIKSGLLLSATAAFGGGMSSIFAEVPAATPGKSGQLIWGNLIHLSNDMWSDRPVTEWGGIPKEDLHYVRTSPQLRFDESLWNDILTQMARAGMNMVVIDVGDGIQYRSHPEIAVRNAWSTKKLKQELAKARKLGLEPIPKLNFSTAHDQWLGEYSRAVSTPRYYKVCEELIAEVVNLFDKPRFFHLGYDEETAEHQRQYSISIVRQHELWWHDFLFFVGQVEKHGVRPWIWSDYAWKHGQEFREKMPRAVLQSNWYYGTNFDPQKVRAVQTYLELDQEGFDQVPTGSNWSTPESFGATVEFCRKNLTTGRLKGFLQTPWKPTVEKFRQHHMQAIEQVSQAIARTKS